MVLEVRFYVILKSSYSREETLITRLENGLERKKIAYFLLLEEVGILQGVLKIKIRGQ